MASWQVWAEGDVWGEHRGAAVAQLQMYFDRIGEEDPFELPIGFEEYSYYDCATHSLDLSELGLTTLPPLWPRNLAKLDISKNRLEVLELSPISTLVELNVSSNQLAELCPVPDSIRFLDISGNVITRVHKWPSSAQRIVASNNWFETIPALPFHLKLLSVEYCLLKQLPELPNSLEKLNTANCQLSTLPDELAPDLRLIDVSGNQLAKLPDSYFQSRSGCYSRLEGNLFDQKTMQRLIAYWRKGAAYSGEFSDLSQTMLLNSETRAAREMEMSESPNLSRPPPPLAKAVGQWYAPGQRSTIEKQWCLVSQHFSHDDAERLQLETLAVYLDALGQTAFGNAAKASPQLHSWLTDLRESRNLLQQTCLIAFAATETCHDGLLYPYMQMQVAHAVAKISNSENKKNTTANLALWVDSARQLFRIEMLELEAHRKTQAIRRANFLSSNSKNADAADKEELETYLAYVSELRDALDIPLAPKMVHARASKLDDSDLLEAERRVKQKENKEFVHWLAIWEPWLEALKRIAPDDYAQMEKTRDEMLGGDAFIARVEAELLEIGLADDDDAWAITSKSLTDKVYVSLGCKLTNTCLQKKNQLRLLRPKWPATGTASTSPTPVLRAAHLAAEPGPIAPVQTTPMPTAPSHPV
jgi:Leucine-rich repeat (LRR) protein